MYNLHTLDALLLYAEYAEYVEYAEYAEYALQKGKRYIFLNGQGL